MVELKKLEGEVKKSEVIFYPVMDEAKKVNEKLNKLSDEKLKALNIRDRVELVIVINHHVQGKKVCEEIKGSILNQLQEIGAIKLELQGVATVGMPNFWRANNTISLEVELMSSFQKMDADIANIEVFLSSFNEIGILIFFYSFAKVGAKLQ